MLHLAGRETIAQPADLLVGPLKREMAGFAGQRLAHHAGHQPQTFDHYRGPDLFARRRRERQRAEHAFLACRGYWHDGSGSQSAPAERFAIAFG